MIICLTLLHVHILPFIILWLVIVDRLMGKHVAINFIVAEAFRFHIKIQEISRSFLFWNYNLSKWHYIYLLAMIVNLSPTIGLIQSECTVTHIIFPTDIMIVIINIRRVVSIFRDENRFSSFFFLLRLLMIPLRPMLILFDCALTQLL